MNTEIVNSKPKKLKITKKKKKKKYKNARHYFNTKLRIKK